MSSRRARPSRGASWLRPRTEPQGAIRYLDIIRERWWLVVLATVVAVLVAGIYVVVTPARYQAEADLLISPLSGNETATAGLGLITASNDPTQTVSTAARLVSTSAVAAATVAQLHLAESPGQLLGTVKAEPVASSSLVAIEAERGSAGEAAAVANAFARAAIETSTSQLHAAVNAQLPELRQRLAALPVAEQTGPGSLGERIANLEALASAPNPTVLLASSASRPTGPSSPKRKLAIVAGLIAGLVLGLGAALASQALDPRLRREEQLRNLFQLPVLTRIPRLDGTRGEGPLVPSRLTPAASEAFRTLRATLAATVGEDLRSVLITSSSEAEGKSSASINYAESLALAGRRTLLIEGDLRRPTIARALDLQPTVGIGAVLVGDATMEEAIITTPEFGPNLGFLLVERNSASLADRLSLPMARRLVKEAEELADIVIIDSPPLTQVIDALPIAQEVDAVVIMARLGTSRLGGLAALGEILDQGGITPAGIVIIGDEYASYYTYSTRAVVEEPVT